MNAQTIVKWAGLAALGLIAPIPSLAADPAKVAWIDLSESPTERPNDLAWLMGSDGAPTLRELVDALHRVADDATVQGVVIRLKDAKLTASQVEEIGVVIKAIRAAGKKVHVFAEGYGNTDIMLGSYADEVILQSGGEVSMPGIYMEEMFLADTLAWAGIKADFVQIGDYKGASEQYARASPSKQWDQNISQLLDSMYAHLRDPILRGRKLTDQQLDAAMASAWMADGPDAVKSGLIDVQVDLPMLTDHLKSQYGGEVAIDRREVGDDAKVSMDASNPFAMMAALTKEPTHKPTKPTIALLHIDGAIVDGESTGGFGEGSVGSRTIRNALEDILTEDLIKGVVVRIDSPGGSAIASEIIWQGVRRVAAKKPVWVSVGGMAASGGYYIAVAGDRIYVNPSSIVGSIGVVGGKMALQGLYEKFHINVVGRGRGPRAAMLNSTTPWSADDQKLVKDKMTQTYGLFTKRVAAGRKNIDLAQTAEGRLFTGDRAVQMKMADQIGGLEVAIDDLAKSLNMSDFAVMDYPGPKALGEVIQDALKGFVAAPHVQSPSVVQTQMLGAIREIVGPRAWRQLAPQLRGMLELRDEPIVLLAPNALIWK